MAEADEKTNQLADALEAMLFENEDISARGAVRRLDGIFKYATDVTRHAERRGLLEKYRQRQAELRAVMEKADKQSKSNLSAAIERKNREIEALTRQRDLLIASHRAMILAVSEMRGMKAWQRFFERYQDQVDELRQIGAIPTTDVSLFPQGSKGER